MDKAIRDGVARALKKLYVPEAPESMPDRIRALVAELVRQEHGEHAASGGTSVGLEPSFGAPWSRRTVPRALTA